MKLTDYLGDRGFWRDTVRLALPIAVQNMLASSFSLIDTLMVSRLGDLALSSVGIEAQMGGSAFSKALIKMEVAAATGGDALEDFARVSGMSASQFKDLWERDAASAFQAFIVGLSKMDEEGVSAIKTLDDIGIAEIRLRDTLLRATNASELFNKTQGICGIGNHKVVGFHCLPNMTGCKRRKGTRPQKK